METGGRVGLGRVAGVAIAAHWSLVVVFWLIAWSLATAQLPDDVSGLSSATYWVAGIVTALLFFAGLLAHEIAHAVVARRAGIEVDDITLWLFGGVSRLRGEAGTPATEFQIAVVGPATSLAIAVLFFALSAGFHAVAAPELVTAVAAWLARINLILGVFNLLPAFPLDGGRVLRSYLWKRGGDRRRATEAASRTGRLFAYALIGGGMLELAAGGSVGGIWLAFLGWFLLIASRAELETSEIRAVLSGVWARDIMTPHPVVVSPAITLQELFDEYVVQHRFSSFPVEDADGSLEGLITMRLLKLTPTDEWPATRVRDVARPIARVPIVAPGDPAADVFAAMRESQDGRAFVVEKGLLIGIVSPTDVARALELAGLTRAAHGVSGSRADP